MVPDWLLGDAALVWRIPLSAAGIYVAIIVMTRLNGLRTFSKMSGFDFAMTVATGSLVATTALQPDIPLLGGAVALASLFVLQHVVAQLRKNPRLARWIDNEPLLLVRHGRILEDNLRRARVSEDDLWAKLRENSVLRLQDVEAVVLETTGTMSVLKRQSGVGLEDRILHGIRS